MAEGQDWARTQFEACPDCGWDSSNVSDEELGDAVVAACATWPDVLADTAPDALSTRPAPSIWGALEYAGHVRDLIAIFTGRIERIRTEDDPALGWWDHEAAAVDDDYAGQDPDSVGRDLVANGAALAALLADIAPGEWDRAAERRPGEGFTVRGAARFVIHEIVHHRMDADAVIAHAMRPSGRRADDEAMGTSRE